MQDRARNLEVKTHTHTHTHSILHSHSRSYTAHSLLHTHIYTHSLLHTHIYTHTHSYTHIYTRTHSLLRTHVYAHTHTLKHPFSLSLSLSLTLSLSQAFKDGQVQFLICTDLAARGIDVKGLPYVINMTLPDETDTYFHRIGTTLMPFAHTSTNYSSTDSILTNSAHFSIIIYSFSILFFYFIFTLLYRRTGWSSRNIRSSYLHHS